MRDFILTAVVFGALPVCLFSPYFGVLVWSWLGFMNPQKIVWSFGRDLPFSQYVAVATLLGLAFTRDRRPIPRQRETGLLLALWAIMTLSTVFALYPDLAWPDWERVSKILLMVFVMLMLCQERMRLRWLLLVTALSIGFYGLKGGIWSVATGGQYLVLGPEASFIGDNNGLAMGLNMTLPLLFFLALEERRRWLRWFLRVMFAFSIVASLLTYSRAGFLGLVVVILALLLRTEWKRLVIPSALLGIAGLALFLPQQWYARIETIATYERDSSAMSRLHAWYVGWRLALDLPLLGGGFRAFSKEIWSKYLPEYGGWHNAHSIYFHVLGEHGFTGAAVYLALIISTLLSLRRVRREARRIPDASWMVDYSYMVEASLLGFLVTGAFQNLTHFDLFYLMIAITIILKQLVQDRIAIGATQVHVGKARAPMARRPAPLSTYWRSAR